MLDRFIDVVREMTTRCEINEPSLRRECDTFFLSRKLVSPLSSRVNARLAFVTVYRRYIANLKREFNLPFLSLSYFFLIKNPGARR